MSAEHKTKEVIDNIAGAGTADKLEGKLHEAAGKTKQAVSHLTDDPELHAEGKAEESEGRVQQVMGTVSAVAHGVADAVVDGAHKLGDAVKHMVHHDEQKKES